MYLRSIEVQGFKSFANKIRFDFHDGITGIVGPNGSGKSNVADAVRWVLGEQKVKQLRGSTMQDVIFSGSELRKPLSSAYVSITLDNQDHSLNIDYPEVVVARRLYRSGESEYMINGAACRLRDINELFYDTGIGKEGYSIIGQGQIDRIISGKPEERRELFDEAAGIVKYKRRKEASIKKLENEEQNLVRVSDILSELERQVGPLERQSKKAREYLDKREALKGLDINLFLLENEEMTERLKTVSENHSIAEENLESAKERLNKVRNSYDELQQELDALKGNIEKSRNQIQSSILTRGKLENEIAIATEQIKNAKANEAHYEDRLAALTKDAEEKKQERDRFLEEKEKSDKRIGDAQADRDAAADKLSDIQKAILQLNDRSDEIQQKILDEMGKRSGIKASISRLDALREQNEIQKASLTSRFLEAKSEEVKQREVIESLEKEFQEHAAHIKELEDSLRESEVHLSGFKKTLSDADVALQEAQDHYRRTAAKLESLRNIAERYEGFGTSVRIVMEQRGRVPGIEGVVADLIKVDERYEVAIETALGGALQNVVTDKEETARILIDHLKRVKGGRATFLPLNALRDSQAFSPAEALRERGVVGPADSLVSTEEKYEDVPRSLLSRILVVDTYENAVNISRKYRHRFRIVTLSGENFAPGGAISGGAYKNASNLLGRRRDVEDLQQEAQEKKEETGRRERRIQEIKAERNTLRLEIETKRLEIQNAHLSQNTADVALSQAREKMEEARNGFVSIKDEEETLKRNAEELELQKEGLNSDLETSENFEKAGNEELAAIKKELETKREEETSKLKEVSELEIQLEKIRQASGFTEENLKRAEEDLERVLRDLQDVESEKGKSAKERTERETNIGKLQETIQASVAFQEAEEERLAADTARQEELSVKQRESVSERDVLSDQIAGFNREVERLGAQKDRLQDGLLSKSRYMWDEYEITLSEAASYKKEDYGNAQEMRSKIASLKDEIKKLGDVNVNAIEEYREISERYTFLKTQHDDLVEAKKELEQIIQDLDVSMREQFTEKFAEIARVFNLVFKELFGGGKGSLELMEGEDILEAGIRIIAQPPGKKLQNMMQLSGGEKALTAICLLFAIQDLKPSPFCLLDEIEAALDDNNVIRFSRYLHKLEAHTQFIVITHRRGTMESCDRLYGITMQEKGISTLVSVNLIDKELA
ncbi:MAG: chromosome segregation protein SMC [Lachnospiraceae bacterium]|nr:chromosome segregation protein SMC [Lachnospiraceae bacterium]